MRAYHAQRSLSTRPVQAAGTALASSAQTPPSSSLLAANRRLLALRARHATSGDARRPAAEATPPLPDHLGWGSAALTRLLGRESTSEPAAAASLEIVAEAPEQLAEATTVRVWPALLNGLLRNELTVAGRVWLLLRHLDRDGRGWIDVTTVRSRLTGKGAALRICGWRRMRQILQNGRDLFWQRDGEGRLWLAGTARVAARLGVERFGRHSVQLPIAKLTGSLAVARAAFLAAFHAARDDDQPISRAAIEALTGVQPRRQRRYDRLARVERNANFLVAGSADDHQPFAAEHGRAAFILIDRQGRFGRPDARYNARRLPNSYRCRLQTASGRCNRRLNRKLRDLGDQRGRGNAQSPDQRYYTDARRAAEEQTAGGPVYLQANASGFWFDLTRKV